jgi:hypothetical protein
MLNKNLSEAQVLPKLAVIKMDSFERNKFSENILTYPFTRSMESQIYEELCDMNKDTPLST